jgi:TATA-binding protein-associated factor Taf7
MGVGGGGVSGGSAGASRQSAGGSLGGSVSASMSVSDNMSVGSAGIDSVPEDHELDLDTDVDGIGGGGAQDDRDDEEEDEDEDGEDETDESEEEEEEERVLGWSDFPIDQRKLLGMLFDWLGAPTASKKKKANKGKGSKVTPVVVPISTSYRRST